MAVQMARHWVVWKGLHWDALLGMSLAAKWVLMKVGERDANSVALMVGLLVAWKVDQMVDLTGGYLVLYWAYETVVSLEGHWVEWKVCHLAD